MALSRRDFVAGAAAGATLLATARAQASSGRSAIYKEIDKRHDESVARLQDWLRQGSIAAENVGMQEGCETMRRLALERAFSKRNAYRRRATPGCLRRSMPGHGRHLRCISCTT